MSNLRIYLSIVGFVLILPSLTSCFSNATEDSLRGRMLIWHTWANGEIAPLDEVFATFQELHPNVTIKQQYFADVDEMLAEFQVAADAGLGPDLIIVPNEQIRSLAETDLIDPIEQAVDESVLQRFMPAAIDALRYREHLYGLPATMDTQVLYYDTSLVQEPVDTLDKLLAEAEAGRVVSISTNFRDAFWGVQAFGGRLFDEDYQVILDRGGFANWLAWLETARNAPGMILDSNREALRNRFVEDGVAYYVGYASELNTLVESMGEENLGVAVLPAGPNGTAAPFLTVQALLFSTVSSENQRALALELALFVTNAEQQSTLMRQVQLLPVNTRVRINPRLNPVVANFAAQARTALPILNVDAMDAVLRLGEDAYTRVLEGVMEPAEASFAVTEAINIANGFETVATPQFRCRGVGTIYLGYLLSGRQVDALMTILAQLRRDCPTIIVDAQPIELTIAATPNGDTIPNHHTELTAEEVDQLSQRLGAALVSNGRLDLLLVPHGWIPPLVAKEQLYDLAMMIDAEILQRYRPVAVEAMRYQGGLYGLPMTVDVNALYYNRQLVAEPARTLGELRNQAIDGTPVTLGYSFVDSFWGIPAYGGRIADQQLHLALGQGAWIAWLRWLQDARDEANIVLTRNQSAWERAFLEQNSAYYIDEPDALHRLEVALGADNVGVARLPSGPEGDAGPLLNASGFLVSARLTEIQANLAIEVINYMTSVESQTIFLEEANQIPANIGLNVEPGTPAAALIEQVGTALLLANTTEIDILLQLGNDPYLAVLEEGIPPEEAVENTLRQVEEALTALGTEK